VQVKPESPQCGNAAKPSVQHIFHAAQHWMLQRAAALHKVLSFQAVLRNPDRTAAGGGGP
jgi:hypothetical protein